MHSAFLGEFLGTMIMMLLGNGVVANVVLRQTKGEKSGWIVITTGWCFGVMAGVFTALAIGSDGHLNPAVTVGVAVSPTSSTGGIGSTMRDIASNGTVCGYTDCGASNSARESACRPREMLRGRAATMLRSEAASVVRGCPVSSSSVSATDVFCVCTVMVPARTSYAPLDATIAG